jgi:FdhD protein
MNIMDALDQAPVAPRHVWQVRDDETQEQEINVVLEEPLALHLNGNQVAVLMRMPGMEKELAAGFCLSEGLVARFADIYTIHHCGQGLPSPLEEAEQAPGTSRNRVELRVRPEALRPDARLEVVRLIRAGCGAVDIDHTELSLTPVQDGDGTYRVDYRVLLGLDKSMRAEQQLHREVGGVHAAALYDLAGKIAVLCEDIGRHNAVDKAIGYCLLRDIPVRDKLLLCSGRFSYEMVTKAVRLGIPLIASFSAPTALAVQFAERFNVTIVGYLRGSKMTVYTHPGRIRMPG